MQREDLNFLLSPAGAASLEALAGTAVTDETHLQLASQLRERFPISQAQAILETLLLRQKAANKFSRAGAMFFTRPALEQASAEVVSAHRAQRYHARGLKRIADLGCGIGGDSLALAASADVIGVDWDPVRLDMAAVNCRVYGRTTFQPLRADLTMLDPLPVDAVFFDPARRDSTGRRLKSVAHYRPPLSLIERWCEKVPDAGVKISPGVDYAELPGAAEAEFLSVAGDVRECILWYGGLRSEAPRRATLLPSGATLIAERVDAVEATVVGAYLYEPDGAVIRAHLVEHLAHLFDATKIDDDIAFLTADRAIDSPFARGFTVLDTLPFQLKRLRHYLRERHVGQVTIKKRGSPLEPAQLSRDLRLKGDGHRTLILTHVRGVPSVIIAEPLPHATPAD